MKRTIITLATSFLLGGCSISPSSTESTLWIVEKQNGERDTLEAIDCWSIGGNAEFVRFNLSDGTVRVYNSEDVRSFHSIVTEKGTKREGRGERRRGGLRGRRE